MDHAVEGSSEESDLVFDPDRHCHIQLAFVDLAHAAQQIVERPHEADPEKERKDDEQC